MLRDIKLKNKLQLLWRGPYVVEEIVSDVSTKILINRKNKVKHNNRLIHYQVEK